MSRETYRKIKMEDIEFAWSKQVIHQLKLIPTLQGNMGNKQEITQFRQNS